MTFRIRRFLVTSRKWPSTVEPAMSINTMQAVRNASDRDLAKPSDWMIALAVNRHLIMLFISSFTR
jgi:hypothetical protein